MPDWVMFLILAVVVIAILLMVHVATQKQDNLLKWEDLVATNGYLNSYKIGYWVGVVLVGWLIVFMAYKEGEVDSGLVGIYLAFLAGANIAMSAIGAKSGTTTVNRTVSSSSEHKVIE